MSTTILKSFDTIVIIGSSSSSSVLSLSGIGLMAKPISTGKLCGKMISNKVIYEKVTQKYNEYDRQYQKDQQTYNFFDKLYRKTLQDNLIDKNEYESSCNVLTKYLDETRNESFLQILKKN